MKVESVTSGLPMQLWQQQQQMQYEQRLIRNAQMLGAQYPNSETQPPNAVPPPDAALRVVQQVDRAPVVLNDISRREARAILKIFREGFKKQEIKWIPVRQSLIKTQGKKCVNTIPATTLM